MVCSAKLTERLLAAKIPAEAATTSGGLCSWDLLASLTECNSGITLLWPPNVRAAEVVACCSAVNVLAAAGFATRAAASALPSLASAVSLDAY